MTSRNGNTHQVSYIVQELITGGELYEYVCNTGMFSAPMVRFYIKQLLQGIVHMHQRGFCHRDLKASNIMLDSNFNLKIIDMGFAKPTRGEDGRA